MPNITVHLSKPTDAQQKDALQRSIGEAVSIMPGKNIDNTMINLISGCSMYRSGSPLEGAFVDVRLFKASPEEAKEAFSLRLFALLDEHAGISADRVQINFIELDAWASGGSYRR